MAKKAGVITINLAAGTATFIRDMEAAKAKVRDFGTRHRAHESQGVWRLQHAVRDAWREGPHGRPHHERGG
jgi:hypothetical protein